MSRKPKKGAPTWARITAAARKALIERMIAGRGRKAAAAPRVAVRRGHVASPKAATGHALATGRTLGDLFDALAKVEPAATRERVRALVLAALTRTTFYHWVASNVAGAMGVGLRSAERALAEARRVLPPLGFDLLRVTYCRVAVRAIVARGEA